MRIQLLPSACNAYEVVINRWCIGYVSPDRLLGFRAKLTGRPYGELDPFETSTFTTKEAAKDAIIAVFKTRIKGSATIENPTRAPVSGVPLQVISHAKLRLEHPRLQVVNRSTGIPTATIQANFAGQSGAENRRR